MQVPGIMLKGIQKILEVYAQKKQGFAGRTGSFPEDGQYDMFRQKLIRIKTPGFMLGVHGQNTLSPVGESLKQRPPPLNPP
jgi:hypothetical protein